MGAEAFPNNGKCSQSDCPTKKAKDSDETRRFKVHAFPVILLTIVWKDVEGTTQKLGCPSGATSRWVVRVWS